jgi:uncharacterized protein DUF2252
MSRSTSIIATTLGYERWLGEHIAPVQADLAHKHALMTQSLSSFLRGTYYHWALLWPQVCTKLSRAPKLLAVGDVHLANFGTWRDGEGRLVWGVNDLDETATMPYAADLVRLATSALIERRAGTLALSGTEAADSIAAGYRHSLEMGGAPLVLEEQNAELRQLALQGEREPARYWAKLRALRSARPPRSVRHLLTAALPEGAAVAQFKHRIAGVGSLGRPRFLALASCHGGLVAREAKAWLPSAWSWANGKSDERAYALRLLERAVRQPDPFYQVQDGWIIRRLAPLCGRIDQSRVPRRKDERQILIAMGREIANLHLATAEHRNEVLKDLAGRKPGWLLKAARKMAAASEEAWHEFRGSKLARRG